jgi:DNA/RNA-binding domain of Phe-tRNA-synthetase-like protein
MATVNFIVAEECTKLGLRAGAILFRNVRVSAASPALRSEIAQEITAIRAKFADREAVRRSPEVVAFREILRKVDINLRKEQPSVERLLTFALKRGDLPAVNSLVDAYNLVSIRSLCSLGAHDLDAIVQPVSLRLLTGRESFTPLGRTTEVAVAAGEYGYVDGSERVLCRLDVLQADFSKVTASTVNAFLIIEATAAHPAELVRQTFADAADMITRHCGGSAQVVCSPPAHSA